MIYSDFLVLGSGIAGLSFALKAADHGSVIIVTKGKCFESNTRYAQGGIACVLGDDDDPELHIHDTMIAGAGLCNRSAVEMIVKNAPQAISELISIGVRFSMKNGDLDLGLEGGHSRKRIAHHHDFTGREIERALIEAVKSNPSITIYEYNTAVDLIVSRGRVEGSECEGAIILDNKSGEIEAFYARKTILCTGGAGQVFLHTTNPEVAVGDGLAIAYRAGATLANLEFVQFHPTMLYMPGEPSFLISEALRGAGARLVNSSGEEFMYKYHSSGALAPRDIVSRAIAKEMSLSGDSCVFLDAREIPTEVLETEFPMIRDTCSTYGINISEDLIPVVPSAHYMCGGVLTNLSGESSISGLYALGEVACTGVHGANRLASNSLLEAVVFAEKALEDILAHPFNPDKFLFDVNLDNPPFFDKCSIQDLSKISKLREEIRTIMWEYCGIIRNSVDLAYGSTLLGFIEDQVTCLFASSQKTPELLEINNLVLVARLIIHSAFGRHESRGAHFTVDYQENTSPSNEISHVGLLEELLSETGYLELI